MSPEGESTGPQDLRRGARGERFTTSRGVLHFVRSGAGSPVVLLHGLGSSHRSFEGVVSLLSRRHQVLSTDLLGHGSSDRIVRDLSVTAQAEALIQVLSEMRLEPVSVVGHGLGGRVALRVAAGVPQKIGKVVLLAAGSHGPPVSGLYLRASAWGLLGLLGAGTRRRLAERLCGERVVDPAAVESLRGWLTLGRAFRQAMNPEALAETDELVEHYLRHPIFVLWGTEDRVSPVGLARSLFAYKRDVRFVEINGGSHTPHEDTPDIVAELILDFID